MGPPNRVDSEPMTMAATAFRSGQGWILLLLILFAVNCDAGSFVGPGLENPGEGPGNPVPATIRLEVRPGTASLAPGGTEAFDAVALLTDGSTQSIAPVWSATGGSISDSGVYTAGTNEGTFRVVARYQDTFADTAVITVEANGPGEAASVHVTPSTVRISGLGRTVQLTAEARDASGNVLPDASFAWNSEDPNIASVSEEGIVTSKGLGQVVVMAALLCGTTACDAGFLVGQTAVYVDSADRAARYPNEPAGYVPWFSHDWQTWLTPGVGQLAGSEAGYINWHSGYIDRQPLVDDPEAPHGIGKSVRILLPENHPAGVGFGSYNIGAQSGGSYLDHVSTQLGEVYLSFWVLWEAHPDNDKIELAQMFRFLTFNRHLPAQSPATDGTALGFSMRALVGHVSEWYAWELWGAATNGANPSTTFHSQGPNAYVGQWYHVELLWKRLNLDGAWPKDGDSEVKLWANGDLIADRVITHGANYPVRQIHINPNPSGWFEPGYMIEDEQIAVGDGTTTRYKGSLAKTALERSTLIITAGGQTVKSNASGEISGDVGGPPNTATQVWSTYDFSFASAPPNGTPILASYQSRAKTRDDYMRYAGLYVSGKVFQE
jgi:hypothetical protein